jgi:type IV pilus assembly protein PilO
VDISIDDLKKLSPAMKALIVAVVCLLLGYFYYMFFLQGMIAKQISVRAKLADMQTQIAQKEKVAAQLAKYKKEVSELSESLKIALLKLPNEKEIAGLLASVVLSGKETGINFLLFEPKAPPATPPVAQATAAAKKSPKTPAAKPAEPQKFYEEIPINVTLSGAFHNTVSFFAKVAKLPRIVNVEDIEIAEAKKAVKGGGMVVKTSCKMKTYMFVDKGQK